MPFKLVIPAGYNSTPTPQKDTAYKSTVQTQNTSPVSTPVKKKPRLPMSYNRSAFLRAYLQSLMSWTYDQNPEYAEYLKEDELTNWYLYNMKHPDWFTLEMQKDPFRLVSDMTDYIRQYKDSSETYEQTVKVECIARGIC